LKKSLQKASALFTFNLILLVQLLILPSPTPALELSPFAGYRFGGEIKDEFIGSEMTLEEAKVFGIHLGFDQGPGKQIELLYSRQEAKIETDPAFILPAPWKMTVEYLHIGGLSTYNNSDRYRLFIAGGFGLTQFDPEHFTAKRKASLSLAGGGKLFLTQNSGLRLELRSYWTFLDTSGVVFCNNGSCRILIEGDSWQQFETNLGFFVRF